MVIGRVSDAVFRGIEGAASSVSETLFEPTVRLGVTGLARAGKTVFITSLVANLMDRNRMIGLRAAQSGAIRAAWLQPQPNDTLPRFAFEEHLNALTAPQPRWPESTRAISELRLSFKIQPGGLLGAVSGPRTLHLDIVDYPGEWLLDLGLMEVSYDDWARTALTRAQTRAEAAAWHAELARHDPAARLEEATAQTLARAWTDYLRTARSVGYSDCTPGRFLLPGDLEGSPALTFAPLPPGPNPRGSLRREMARRFEAYKRQVVTPFFRDHFSRIDRQVVLVDLLGAIHGGPPALDDLGQAMDAILGAFRPGRAAWLARLLGQRRVQKLLFAGTKADHLHHSQHARMTAALEALLRKSKDRADYAGAETKAMAIAALRATVEETRTHQGRDLGMVRGRRLDTGKQAAFYPGDLPEDPSDLLAPARGGAAEWLNADYAVMRFAPAVMDLRPGEGPPHIRLDAAAQFLIGDRL